MKTDSEQVTGLEQENQRLRELVASLDELPQEKKVGRAGSLRGVGDINTGASKGIRSIPEGGGSDYLDLFLLQKERERVARETTWLKKRRLKVGRRVADIDKEMARKQERILHSRAAVPRSLAALAGGGGAVGEEPGWKRLTINY